MKFVVYREIFLKIRLRISIQFCLNLSETPYVHVNLLIFQKDHVYPFDLLFDKSNYYNIQLSLAQSNENESI